MSEITEAIRTELALLTPDQVCELLQVKKAWLYDMVERENFPAIRLGSRQLRFRVADVSAWVNGDIDRPAKQKVRTTMVDLPATPPTSRRGRPRK